MYAWHFAIDNTSACLSFSYLWPMETFAITDEYIQLNQLLKVMNWCEDGAHANFLIDEGKVTVNGQKELRRRNKIVAGMIVELDGQQVKVVKNES
jgi:ribosome-associated protein